MQQIPTEIRLTYIVAIIILISLVMFILLISRLFHKKQTNYLLQRQLLENKVDLEKLQAKLDKQAALVEERKRISYDMHDDLGSGLSSIKLLTSLLKVRHKDAETINDLNLIINQTSNLTNSMRELVWYLNPDNDTIEEFILYIIKYGKKFFDPLNINFQIVYPDKEIVDKNLEGLKRKNLFLCIKEIFNNILKHSKANKVIFSYRFVGDELNLIIQDNGIGMIEENNSNTGIKSLKKRVKSFNGSINFQNKNGGLYVLITAKV